MPFILFPRSRSFYLGTANRLPTVEKQFTREESASNWAAKSNLIFALSVSLKALFYFILSWIKYDMPPAFLALLTLGSWGICSYDNFGCCSVDVASVALPGVRAWGSRRFLAAFDPGPLPGVTLLTPCVFLSRSRLFCQKIPLVLACWSKED